MGYQAGYYTTGHGNVFLGYNAGFDKTGSEKLYIDSTSTSSLLLWSDFSYNILTVNGKFALGTKSPAYAMKLETTGENAAFVAQRTDGAMCTAGGTWQNYSKREAKVMQKQQRMTEEQQKTIDELQNQTDELTKDSRTEK